MFCIDPYYKYKYMIFRTVYHWYKFQKARKMYLKFFIDNGVMNITSVLQSPNYSPSCFLPPFPWGFQPPLSMSDSTHRYLSANKHGQ